MEKKNIGTLDEIKMEHRNCNNCGARMEWNFVRGRWECNLCGNAFLDKYSDPLNRFPRMY